MPVKQQEQVITTMIKKKEDSGANLQLATKGRKLQVSVHTKKVKKVVISAKSLDDYKAVSGSSSTQMKKLINFIRCSAGKHKQKKRDR